MSIKFLTTCVDESSFPVSHPGNNPFASPDFKDAYKADWSLLKQIMFWSSMMSIFCLACYCIVLWQQGSGGVYGPFSNAEKLYRFFFDWNVPQGM
jgi:hypothetical protein